jgi:hypothetical protein
LALDDNELADFRNNYRDRASRLGLPSGVNMLVDMDPLKGLKMPIILKLFPGAKIIAIRATWLELLQDAVRA